LVAGTLLTQFETSFRTTKGLIVPILEDKVADTPLLCLNQVSKKYGAFSALSEIDFQVFAGRTHCLLGENGAGKSTLCKIIFGEELPSSGNLTLAGKLFQPQSPADALNAGIAMVHQHFSLIPSMSVCENLMLGSVKGLLKPLEFAQKLLEVSKRYGLQLDPWKLVGDLSVGQQQRVEILKCLLREPNIVILDEPTAVLLPDEIDALLSTCEQIVAEGRAVILVTHKLPEIARVADEVTVLREGKNVMHQPFAADQMNAMVNAMIGSDMNPENLDLSRFTAGENEHKALKTGSPKQAMIIDGVSYRDSQGNQKLNEVTLMVNAGEIIGLAGVEGNGQSELGAILAGLAKPNAGSVYLQDKDLTDATPAQITSAGVGIVPEDRHAVACIKALTLTENLILADLKRYQKFGWLNRRAMRETAQKFIKQFDIRSPSEDTLFGNLSGGNQQKAVLARELSLNPLHFLLAAQPTRGLDIGAVSAVYENIVEASKKGVAVLLISSELDDLIAVCDKIAVIYRGRIAGTLPALPENRKQIGAWMAGSGLAT